MDIKILNTFEEFTNPHTGMKYGLYEVSIDKCRTVIVSRNHNTFRVLRHSPDGNDDLLVVTKAFSDGLLEILGVSGESEE
jgi:hypothetical protein